METIDEIPIHKLNRASKIAKAGAKVGINYLAYLGNRTVKTKSEAKEILNKANADDIYDEFKKLKGSALKMAQMLSMDHSILPQAYVDKFSLAQFSVPPLSPPLVLKTFKKYFGEYPDKLFDEFDVQSIRAASIGQVHKAKKDGREVAVKIQYPGVAESISSDLQILKRVAPAMFNIPSKGLDKYYKEVENKLIEETKYELELKQSQEIAEQCQSLTNIIFPKYYPELSNEKIITMDWMKGHHISEFCETNKSQEKANIIGQILWDFYMHQFHVIKKFHADPHPGNFLVTEENTIAVIDFGCMKAIPETFYTPYVEITHNESSDSEKYQENLYTLEILKKTDTKEEKRFFKDFFSELILLISKPFREETFDFSNKSYFDAISKKSVEIKNIAEKNKYNSNRGSEHFIYINRTFYGLYSMLFSLSCNNIKTKVQ